LGRWGYFQARFQPILWLDLLPQSPYHFEGMLEMILSGHLMLQIGSWGLLMVLSLAVSSAWRAPLWVSTCLHVLLPLDIGPHVTFPVGAF